MSRAARIARWFAGLATLLVMLRRLGSVLEGPPNTSLEGIATWIDRTDPATVAMWLVRSAAEATLWYVLAISALHAASTATRSAAGLRLADAIGLAGTSQLVRAGLGAGLVASTSVTAVPVAASPEPGEPGTAVMRPLDDEATTSGSESPLEHAPAVPPVSAPPAPPPPGPGMYTVEPGDSLWLIAHDVLEGAWRRPPTDREIDPFWRALIETNRHRFVTQDADLILPGQVFEVPGVPPPPA